MSITDNTMTPREMHMIGGSTREWIVSAALCPALSAHDITLAGLTEAGPDFRFVRADPSIAQTLACTGGRGWVWIDGGWECCEAGQMYHSALCISCLPGGRRSAVEALLGAVAGELARHF